MSGGQKLSPAQAELLEAMRRGVRVYYMVGVHAYWFRSDTMRPCTKQAMALRDRGLIEDGPENLMLLTEATP